MGEIRPKKCERGILIFSTCLMLAVCHDFFPVFSRFFTVFHGFFTVFSYLKTIPIPDPQFFTNFGSKSGASCARYSFAWSQI